MHRRSRRRPGGAAEQDDREGVFSQVLGNPAVKSFLRSAAAAAGRKITRGLFGTRKR